ncbi:MAG: hypothetical protein Q7R52_05000, partial [archaeon]|nr:hypothetical protein [archaeon]
EFYRRLFSSIYDGLKFSYKFEIKDREAIFDGNPSLIIGTNHARPVYGECSNLYGETFEVGYGLWRDFGIHGITMEKDEIEDAKKKMRKFAQELNHSIYERYELAFFIAGEVTRRFIPKIHKKLSQ